MFFSKIKAFLFRIFLFLYKLFISLKLAVFVLSALAVLTGAGTFVESKYNQEIANKLIYHSLGMTIILLLLALNLSMVLIDRWPWKKKQTGFVLAHIGILTLLFGSFWTKYFGLDGSVRLKEGGKSSFLSVSDMEIKIYSSYDGENFSLIYEKPVDMLFIKPSKKKPYVISTGGEQFIINSYLPFAVGRESFKPTNKKGEPAVRFHLDGSQANVVEWIKLPPGEKTISQSFGPAVISLTKNKSHKAKSPKELSLFVEGKKLFYSLGQSQKKNIRPGTVFPTGWMDFKFRLIEFFPKSQRKFIWIAKDRPSDATLKAIHVNSQGQSVWAGQNSYVKFFKQDRVYALGYLNKTYELGFDLKLIDFRLKKYQGDAKAKSYESEVQFEDQVKVISMNKPLKHKGWTFYQSSFEEGKEGEEPVVSILSVNRDPGRPLKYTGSLLIVLGIALLFYRRWKKAKKKALPPQPLN